MRWVLATTVHWGAGQWSVWWQYQLRLESAEWKHQKSRKLKLNQCIAVKWKKVFGKKGQEGICVITCSGTNLRHRARWRSQRPIRGHYTRVLSWAANNQHTAPPQWLAMVNGMAGLQFHPTRCHLNLEPGIDTNATIVSACLWATASATGKKVVGNNQWRAITIAAATCLPTIQVARQLDLCGFSNHSQPHGCYQNLISSTETNVQP